MAEENEKEKSVAAPSAQVEVPVIEELEVPNPPGWRKILRQAFDKARREQRVMKKSDKGRDQSGSLFLLAGAAIALLLLFLGVFSSPNTSRKSGAVQRVTPDLGRRITPGQQTTGQAGSVTPLLNAQTEQSASQGAQQVTSEDVNQTARPIQSITAATANPATSLVTGNEGQYALGRVHFSGPATREQALENNTASGRSGLDDLKKPSLVFIRSAQTNAASTNARITPAAREEGPVMLALPAGTRLVARLQSVVTSAVKAPVVAAIEYNYEKDGEIVVPAGATAIGTLEQADRSGYVAIRFDSLQLPDGSSERIDAAAMSLDHGPLKGRVSGKRTGTNFLVRAFTGLGEAATYLVGSGGLSAPLSESAFLRDRIATNIGTAGDQELNGLAFNQNIIVTVPANTRFYIVMEKGETESGEEAPPAVAGQIGKTSPPSPEELRQLMQLKRELSEMYEQPNTPQPAPQQ
ncbi:MAG TPA: hypothetical protein VGS27_14495 [Candidatus Sulfotelmatobacter sp.]|nr:hypothetical protein [Candidatus Sulfotelmatobacter sp.]